MSNGILSALKQHNGSLDELAALPQTFIMQMAQRKEISPDMVAPILARKAEMAEATARSKALHAQGAPSTSVMDQIMQKNASAEHPPMTDGRDMGVAQLPVQESQYAGGGIVSFATAGSVKAEEPPAPLPGESENAYMQRVQAIYGMGSEFFKAKNYNPFAKMGDLYSNYIGEPFAKGMNTLIDERKDIGTQADKFRSYSQKPKTEAGIAALAPKTPDSQYEQQGKEEQVSAFRAEAAPKQNAPARNVATDPTKEAAKVVTPETKADVKSTDGEKAQSSTDELISKYEKMIMGDPAESKKARDEAKYLRLMEAGLGIMGGTSSNFAENVGKGATQAMKGYAEDVKGFRAEETAKLNQLASLGLKGEQLKLEAQKLGITSKHYDQWYASQMEQIKENNLTRRMASSEAAASRKDNKDDRAGIARDNRITNMYKAMKDRGDNMNLSDEEIYAKATQMVTGQSPQNQFAGFSGRPLK